MIVIYMKSNNAFLCDNDYITDDIKDAKKFDSEYMAIDYAMSQGIRKNEYLLMRVL